MRDLIKLVENADADNMYDDATLKIKPFSKRDNQDFGDKGRADLSVKMNNPRFADNAMSIDEYADTSFDVNDEKTADMDRIHQMLSQAGITDQEIIQGINISQNGKNKIAGQLGISPSEVDLLIATLEQKLSDGDETDALIDDYYMGMYEGVDSPWKIKHSFKKLSERLSYEPDSMGNMTIRNTETGAEKYIQGFKATELLSSLKKNGSDEQSLLRDALNEKKINEDLEDDNGSIKKTNYLREIKSNSGTYNFPWSYDGEHGFATAFFSSDDEEPVLEIESVRDYDGNEIDFSEMYDIILQQAKDFLGNE